MATAKKAPASKRIRDYLAKHPGASAKVVAKAVGVKTPYVYTVKHTMVTKAKNLPVTGAGDVFELEKQKWVAVEPMTSNTSTKTDNVNHPAHYKVGGIETIDFIEAKQLSYHLGNVIKYITRAGHKGNELEDLHKARWYLNREIARREGAK